MLHQDSTSKVISCNAIGRLTSNLNEYIRERLNHEWAKKALAQTYALTYDRLRPEFPPFHAHVLSKARQLLPQARLPTEVKRFRVGQTELQAESEKVRYGRKMSLRHLLLLVAATVEDRSNFNVLYEQRFYDVFDFAVATELFTILKKYFNFSRELNQIDKNFTGEERLLKLKEYE